MTRRIMMTACVALLAMAVAAPAMAGPVVTNGSFSTFTPSNNSQAACNTSTTAQTVTNCDLSGWATTSGYSFILNSTNATGGFTGPSGSLSLYGPIGASPDGGNFLATDGGYLTGYTYTTVTGLVVGQFYNVSFFQAAAQQSGYTGATTDQWTVGLGATYATSSFINGTLMNLASGAFSGWMAQTVTFVATATSEVLSFMATGTPAGQPPFALLDGVSVTVPEPPAYGLLVVGLIGLLSVRRVYGKRATRRPG